MCGNARIRLPRAEREGGAVKKRLNGARRGWKKSENFYKNFTSSHAANRHMCALLPLPESLFEALHRTNIEHSNIYSTCSVYLRQRSKSSDESDSAKTFSNIYSISPFSSFLLPSSVFAFISIILKSNANIFKEFREFFPLDWKILQFLMLFFRWVFAHSQFPLHTQPNTRSVRLFSQMCTFKHCQQFYSILIRSLVEMYWKSCWVVENFFISIGKKKETRTNWWVSRLAKHFPLFSLSLLCTRRSAVVQF